MKKKSLGDRIKKLRLSFQKPYYFFSMMENGNIVLYFEDNKADKIFFRETTMVGVVKKAEDYLVASQIRAGQQAKIEEKSESTTTTTSPSKSADANGNTPMQKKDQEDDGIEVKTTVIDSDGKEHPQP